MFDETLIKLMVSLLPIYHRAENKKQQQQHEWMSRSDRSSQNLITNLVPSEKKIKCLITASPIGRSYFSYFLLQLQIQKLTRKKTSTTTELEPKTSFERSLECWFIEI